MGSGYAARMPNPSSCDAAALRALARRQRNLATLCQLATVGVSGTTASKRSRADGPWQRILPHVHLLQTGAADPHQRLLAAVLYASARGDENRRPPTALLTGRAALALHGIPAAVPETAGRHAAVSVLVENTRRIAGASYVRIVRTRRWPGGTYLDGIPSVRAPRAAADAAAYWTGTATGLRAVLASVVQADWQRTVERRLRSADRPVRPRLATGGLSPGQAIAADSAARTRARPSRATDGAGPSSVRFRSCRVHDEHPFAPTANGRPHSSHSRRPGPGSAALTSGSSFRTSRAARKAAGANTCFGSPVVSICASARSGTPRARHCANNGSKGPASATPTVSLGSIRAIRRSSAPSASATSAGAAWPAGVSGVSGEGGTSSPVLSPVGVFPGSPESGFLAAGTTCGFCRFSGFSWMDVRVVTRPVSGSCTRSTT